MQTATNDERRLSKTEVEAESYVNESENLMDFGFAKKLSESDNIRIRTPSHPYYWGQTKNTGECEHVHE